MLDIVEESGHLVGTGLLHHHGDDVAQRTLREDFVDITDLLGHHLIEEDAADGRLLQFGNRIAVLVDVVHQTLHDGVQVRLTLVVGDDSLLRTVEYAAFALHALAGFGDVVQTEDHVLRRHGDRRAVGRVKDVVRTEHQQLGLQNGGIAQRKVHGHLVAVEVGVERRTCQRVELHCLALDQLGLERLNTQTVQSRGTVHQHGVSLYDILQNTPDHGVFPVDDLLRGFHRLHDAALDELADHERLVKLGRHVLRNTHLVHLQLRADDDDRTGRIIDTLTQQVLAETALLAFERIRQRLERTVRLVLHGVALARVIEQRIDGLLQHALLVAQDHFRSLDLDEPLQTVVADDDTTVKVVQVRRGETAAVQRHQRTQFGRNDRDDVQHHPFGLVLTLRRAERLDDVQALEGFALTLLRSLGRSLVTQRVGHRIEVHGLQKRVDRLGAHLRDELVGIAVIQRLIALRQRGQHVEILLLRKRGQTLDALLGGGAGVDHDITLVIDDRLQLLRRNTQQVTDLRGQRTEVPDVNHGHDQRNVAHTLAAHLLLGHLHTAAVADDTLVADTLVLAAMAFVVLDGTENAFAEQTVALRLVGTIVNGFGLEHLAARLGQNLLRGGQANRNAAVTIVRLIVFGN